MTTSFVVEKQKLGLITRLVCLAMGAPFFALGVYAAGSVVVACIRLLFGSPVEGHLIYGVMIGLVFTLVGALAIWVFIEPTLTLTFNGKTRVATYVKLYPFGIKRTVLFKFAEFADPEAVWVADTDHRNGGYWALKVTLPNGKVMTKWHFRYEEQEKAKVHDWRDELFGLLRPA